VVGADDRDALYRQVADVLRDSVAKHMRADVTVGAFLSGGIDSTAIAALAKEHNPNLITFTSEFEREGYSEVTWPPSRPPRSGCGMSSAP